MRAYTVSFFFIVRGGVSLQLYNHIPANTSCKILNNSALDASQNELLATLLLFLSGRQAVGMEQAVH